MSKLDDRFQEAIGRLTDSEKERLLGVIEGWREDEKSRKKREEISLMEIRKTEWERREEGAMVERARENRAAAIYDGSYD